MKKKILVLHGPNLNLLGLRETSLYGTTTLAAIDEMLTTKARAKDIELKSFQSNHEGHLIDAIVAAKQEGVHFLIINPAALTHTSIALRDALLAVAIPFIEVHISNIFAREPYRHHSYLSDIAKGVITGLGPQGYTLALQSIIDNFHNTSPAMVEPT
jgi:3-dehydroquinate dehydratase-2